MPKINISAPQVDVDFEDHLDDVYEYDVENNYIGQIPEGEVDPYLQDPQVIERLRKKAYLMSFITLPTERDYAIVEMCLEKLEFQKEALKFQNFIPQYEESGYGE
ncbi:MAG: hypothetical protein DRQ35_05330 [Gammaproteobacteria bacterium]|nr:MAG: hypothetical protein DRQ35_05330 [Gammaproteobacteria bacterium]